MWFIGVEVEQETSAPPPKKNPGSAPAFTSVLNVTLFRTIIPNHEVHLCVSCNGFYFSSFVTKGDRKPFTAVPSIGGCHFCRCLH